MKILTKKFTLILTLFFSLFQNHKIFAQIPSVSGAQCVICKGMNGNHQTWCKYYNGGQTSTPNVSSQKEMEAYIMGALIQSLFSSPQKNNTTSAAEIERQKQLDIQRQQALARQMLLMKKYNDSIAQARHDKMMKDYKTLDAGVKDLQYKGLSDQNTNWDPSVVVLDEQKWLDNNTQTWIEYQKEQFRIRTTQPNYWCEKYYENLKKQDSSIKANMDKYKDYVFPKRLNEVQPGDVILVEKGGWLQKTLDSKINDTQESSAHTLTCIKVVKDKKFYLDNQLGEGPRIITEEQMINRYSKRDLSVAELRGKGDQWGIAQPLSKEEGDKLWNKALELHNKNRDKVDLGYETKDKSDPNNTIKNMIFSNYGLYKDDNMVCSETSWMLVNSTGRYQISEYKNEMLSKAGIKFTPTSFYNTQQYFIISPLATDK